MARDGTVAEQILTHGVPLAADTSRGRDHASADQQTIHVTIRRTPPAPELHSFDVPFTPGMSVFNVLEKIRDTLDPSLAVPISCRIGKCDICFVRINGRVRWSCTAAPIEGMLIEPVLRYFVMKDLVVDYGRRIKAPAGSGDPNATIEDNAVGEDL